MLAAYVLEDHFQSGRKRQTNGAVSRVHAFSPTCSSSTLAANGSASVALAIIVERTILGCRAGWLTWSVAGARVCNVDEETSTGTPFLSTVRLRSPLVGIATPDVSEYRDPDYAFVQGVQIIREIDWRGIPKLSSLNNWVWETLCFVYNRCATRLDCVNVVSSGSPLTHPILPRDKRRNFSQELSSLEPSPSPPPLLNAMVSKLFDVEHQVS